MKKYIFYIIILSVLFLNKVNANDILNLNEPVIEFPSIDNYSLQGFTTTDKYLFMVLNGYDDQKSMIKVYNLNDYTLVSSYDYESLGHANDVTYNSNNKMIYVLAGGGSNSLFEFDSIDFKYTRTIELELPGRSITYMDDSNTYAIRTVTNGFKLDKDLKLYNKMPFIVGMNIKNDLGRQGWAYYNEHIYYSNWSWIRLGGDGANIIFVYDDKGKNVDVLYTDKNIGEIEDIAFYNDKMILGFNGYDDKIKFYMIDVPEINNVQEDIETSLEENTNNDNDINKKIIYLVSGIGVIICVILSIIWNKKRTNK